MFQLHKMSKNVVLLSLGLRAETTLIPGKKAQKWIPALDSRAHSMSAMECYATPW